MRAMAATSDKKYSAEKADYRFPDQSAHKLLQRPAVLAEIARQQQEKLFSEVLPAAVQCLADIIRNDRAPAGARVQAAKVVMDRTLGMDDAKNGKEPHEMTGEELANAIAQLEQIAADRAKPVQQLEASTIDESEDVFG
jgi:phage terminase small subunit